MDDLADIIDSLCAYPSGFSQRNREVTELKYFIDGLTVAGSCELEANKLKREFNAQQSPSEPESNLACENIAALYIKAAKSYGASGNKLEQVNNLSLAAQQYLKCIDLPDAAGLLGLEKAIPLLQKAIAISGDQKHWTFAYRDINFLYATVCRVCRYYEKQKPEKTASYALQLPIIRKTARYLSYQRQGGVAKDAHRIEEGQVGFSDEARIGTDNISQCIAIFAQDPKTLKTGLAHLDNQIDVESLCHFLSQVGPGVLNIRLVGARFDKDYRSQENLIAVKKFLAKKSNVNIISTDIYGGDDGPSAIVVDPHTFELEERVPGRCNPNEFISNAMLLFTPKGAPLVTQFDLTRSPQRSPLYMNNAAISLFRQNYVGRSEWDIEARLIEINYEDRPLCVHAILGLEVAYQKQWNSLSERLENSIHFRGASAGDAELARGALLEQGFYVGQNAKKMNRGLYQRIRQGVLCNPPARLEL